VTTPEQAAWEAMRPVMLGLGLDPRRVENVVGPGHPDVDYSHGNIELKALDAFPKFAHTPIKIRHFTGEQAGWLGQRWEAGGNAWLLVRVGQRHGGSWYLFDGWSALTFIYPGTNAVDWYQQAALTVPPRSRWGAAPAGEGRHCWSRQLRDWLTFDLDRLMPWSRARAMRLRCRRPMETIAGDLDWTVPRLFVTEIGNGTGLDVNTLLDYWNS
jgi:hypothetical protein